MQKSYTAIELDDREDGDEIQNILAEMTGARTVPRVFVNGKCLGGGTEVKKLYDSGELVKKFWSTYADVRWMACSILPIQI